MPAPPTRRFVTEKVAINDVERMVLGRLLRESKHATGMDITCHARVRFPGEARVTAHVSPLSFYLHISHRSPISKGRRGEPIRETSVSLVLEIETTRVEFV